MKNLYLLKISGKNKRRKSLYKSGGPMTVTTTLQNEKQIKPEVLIITGLSGAGKTCAMRSLEDLGFYCVDNLPLPLISAFLDLTLNKKSGTCKVALGIDARGDFFLNDFTPDILDNIKKKYPNHTINIIFVNAQKNTLLKRFQETRRNHPLASGGLGLDDAIQKEIYLLESICAKSDMVIDTDLFSPHDLRHLLHKAFEDVHQPRQLIVKLMSFGFKYGVPAESNLVYDLRFLPNPHFLPALRDYNGTNPLIKEFLFTQPVVQNYWNKLRDFLHLTLNNFYEEGRFFVTVSIGCTGGKHRSVCFTEKINGMDWPNIKFLLSHRDVNEEKPL